VFVLYSHCISVGFVFYIVRIQPYTVPFFLSPGLDTVNFCMTFGKLILADVFCQLCKNSLTTFGRGVYNRRSKAIPLMNPLCDDAE
jgi:hypothetical protein